MNIKSIFLLSVSVAISVSFGRIIEDSKARFILEDDVLDSHMYSCDSLNSFGAKFMPERAVYINDAPFRFYHVALPSSEKPTVLLTDLATVQLQKPLCKEDAIKINTTKNLHIDVSTPILRDGLWVTDIRVPLYKTQGSTISLRKKFKLSVTYNGIATGLNPSKRAISKVENQAAALKFGVSQSKKIKALRKASESKTDNVTFIAKFQVGDKNVATFSEDGIYAVDYKTIRNSLLLIQRQYELDGLPIEKLCLYAASPDTLADMGPGSLERSPNHIFEIPIDIIDHSPNGRNADGIFDEGDSIIFFGYGNAFWKRCDKEDPNFKNGQMDYFHSYSPYTFYQNFIFGYKDSGRGLRFNNKVKVPSASGKNVDFMRYVRAEKDILLRDAYFGKDLDWESATGKEWFWLWHSRFDTTDVASATLNTNETFNLPGLKANGNKYIAVSYFPHRSVWQPYVEKNDAQITNVVLSSLSYSERMSNINFEFKVNEKTLDNSTKSLLPGGNFKLDAPNLNEYGNNFSLKMLPNSQQFDRFDGYSVAYSWTPKIDSSEWLLPGKVSGVINVPTPSGTQIMKFVNMKQVGLLPSTNAVAKDSVNARDDVRYLAVKNGAYRSGLKVEGIPLHSDGVLKNLSRPNSKLEYLIIAPNEFLAPALALAEFRSSGEAVGTFATSVVSLEDIYMQYTGGRISPVAIRNYIAYAYSVCPNLRYVLLAGNGTFDYRGFNAKLSRSLLPPFEKEDAVIEDFFAILDSGETCMYGNYDLDLAVGRLPVETVSEFAQYIDKVKEYEKIGVMDYSDWRSTLLLTADDSKNSGMPDATKHTKYQERAARALDSLSQKLGFRLNLKKIYLLDYAEDASGQKKEAANDFINILNQGAIFTTYFGHGSKTDWASEGLLKPSYVSKLSNRGRYTILGSFSCTVGRFDEGNSRSLSEDFLVAKGAGSIASVGATRETFADYNFNFGNFLLYYALMESGETLGNAFLKSKSNVGMSYEKQRYNNERYVLLGEPVIKMPSSELKISLNNDLDTIKALDKVVLSGSVDGIEDGFVDLALREGRAYKKVDLQVDDDSIEVFYDGALIYSEKVPVKSGKFSTEFITPRKISIGDTAAEFSAWAYSKKMATVGRTWTHNLVISGISTYADSLQDTVPPSIQIQSCYSGGTATNFSDGQTVKLQSPACLQIIIEDSTALDFREQADEGISFEIVGVKAPFHPFPYLEQNSKRAKLRMNFSSEEYPTGKYIFKVRALDVLDNVNIKTLNIEITDNMDVGLSDVFNVPNPMGKKGTTFYFKNLAVDRISHVNIFIYNQNGKLVKVIKNAVSGETWWDGKDNHGRMLANGLYHYVVRSEVQASENFGKKTWTKKQKLLISR